MPQDPRSDQDFLKASPNDQHAYLMATDKDYAKALPSERAAYFRYVTQSGPAAELAPPAGGPHSFAVRSGPEGLEADPNNPHPIVGMPGAWPMNRPVTEKDLIPGAIAGGTAAAIMGGPTLVSKLKPLVIPAAASYAINRAKQLPIVGPIIREIPFAEALPWLFAGGKKEPETMGEEPPAEIAPSTGRIMEQAGGPMERLRNQQYPPPVEYTPPRPSIERLTNEIERTPLTKGEKVTPTTSKILSQELGQATNAPPPLVRGVPLKNQPAAQAAAASKGGLPEGFTPVESSVLKGYRYDPAKQEFTSVTKAGQRYTHAEVTPEEARAFEQAESKGKAWNDLRNNHVQVQKNEMATKPIAPRSASPDDLTSLLEESVKQAKKK